VCRCVCVNECVCVELFQVDVEGDEEEEEPPSFNAVSAYVFDVLADMGCVMLEGQTEMADDLEVLIDDIEQVWVGRLTQT
jgi:hypothetical protein